MTVQTNGEGEWINCSVRGLHKITLLAHNHKVEFLLYKLNEELGVRNVSSLTIKSGCFLSLKTQFSVCTILETDCKQLGSDGLSNGSISSIDLTRAVRSDGRAWQYFELLQ